MTNNELLTRQLYAFAKDELIDYIVAMQPYLFQHPPRETIREMRRNAAIKEQIAFEERIKEIHEAFQKCYMSAKEYSSCLTCMEHVRNDIEDRIGRNREKKNDSFQRPLVEIRTGRDYGSRGSA